jgi:hypothetical protein
MRLRRGLEQDASAQALPEHLGKPPRLGPNPALVKGFPFEDYAALRIMDCGAMCRETARSCTAEAALNV